jgi:hypothetical protein
MAQTERLATSDKTSIGGNFRCMVSLLTSCQYERRLTPIDCQRQREWEFMSLVKPADDESVQRRRYLDNFSEFPYKFC